MTGNWAYFRKHWVKPEVYPLIGAMTAAIGVMTAALVNKARDPTVTWNKGKRKSSLEDQLEGVDEVVPMWSSSKKNRISIFGNGNPVRETSTQFTALPDPITVKVAAAEEEEEEPEEADASAEEESATPEPAAEEPAAAEQPAVLDVVDEAAETINAAVDAAIQSAAAIAAEAEPAASSVAETAASSDPASGADSAPVPDLPQVPKPSEA